MKKPRRFLGVVLLIAAGTGVYANSLVNQFVYDDHVVVEECQFIRSWTNLPALFKSDYFRLSGEATYRPVVTLTYLIDYSLWKLKPFGYHLSNLLLHTANGVLIYFLLRFLRQRQAVALVAALFFCVHPVTAEAVNAVSFREDLLVLTFGLLAYLSYLKAGPEAPRRRLHSVLCVLFYLLALFSKEMAVTLPLLFLLAEICFRRNPLPALKSKRSLYTGIFLTLGFYFLVRFVLLRNPEEVSFTGPPFLTRILTMSTVVFFYLRLLLFPWKLSIEYTFPLVRSFWELKAVLSVAGLALLLGLGIRGRRRLPGFTFGLWWFFLTLLPVTNIIPLFNPVAERYLYFPAVGFCLLLAVAAGSVLLRLQTAGKCVFLSFLVLLFCFYSVRTIFRNRDWRDRLTLYQRTIESGTETARIHYDLGIVYGAKNQYEEAVREYHAAIRLNPLYGKAYQNLGNIYVRMGSFDKAREVYQEAVGKKPDEPIFYRLLGNVYFKRGNYPEAENNWKKARELEPDCPETLNKLAFLYVQTGRNIEEAIRLAREAVSLEPDNPSFLQTLGWAYFKQGDYEKAVAIYQEVIKKNPDSVAAHRALGSIYFREKMYPAAEKEWQKTLELDPEDTVTLNNLAFLYAETEADLEEALRLVKKALSLEADKPEFLDTLGWIYYKQGKLEKASATLRQAVELHPENVSFRQHLEVVKRTLEKKPH